MRSHARDKASTTSRLAFTGGKAIRLYRALCGLWVESFVFLPAAECYCQRCRDVAAILRDVEG